MSALIAALAWSLALVALMVGAALIGRPHREEVKDDPLLSYDQTRFSDRNRHARRVREEELAEMRRRENARGLGPGLHA